MDKKPKMFRVYIEIEGTVTTQHDKTIEWVEQNVLDSFHDELIDMGYIVGEMTVEEEKDNA
jgi:hypothetical protein